MADYLKLAPYRADGAGRGCRAAGVMSTLETSVDDNSCVSDIVGDDGEGEGDRSDDGDDESESDDDYYDEGDAGDVEGDSDVEDD